VCSIPLCVLTATSSQHFSATLPNSLECANNRSKPVP
jgi:hypothetical protein